MGGTVTYIILFFCMESKAAKSTKLTMDSTPMTITSLAIVVLLVLLMIMLSCHYLAPRTTSWLRSNKEEKIGLSKNKLFHANGYMIHSGSEFLLSTSGSFKRFDTIDRDVKQSGHQQQPNQRPLPLWNLPQTENKIPPQPLRPAPAPGTQGPPYSAGHTKSVTFSFTTLQETSASSASSQSMETALNENFEQDITLNTRRSHETLVSCMRSKKNTPIPQAIEAPPPPRLATTPSQTSLLATAIPRPVAKRQVPVQCVAEANMAETNVDLINEEHESKQITTTNGKSDSEGQKKPTLTRRNSSTNPFLCESIESVETFSENVEVNTIVPKTDHNTNAMLPSTLPIQGKSLAQSESIPMTVTQSSNGNNPFYAEAQVTTASTVQPCNAENTIDSNTSEKLPVQRNRSLSETEAADIDLTSLSTKLNTTAAKFSRNTTNPFANLNQKVKGPHLLQKTFSEDFLFRKIPGGSIGNIGNSNGGQTTWSFGRSFLRQDSLSSIGIGRRNSSQVSLDSTVGSMDGINLERAISCDSVNSESSVVLSDLEQPYTQITGYLCVGLQYNKDTITTEGMELTVNIIEAKEVICPLKVDSFDTFVRIYLVPDQAGAMQTQVMSNTLSPIYNESFTFWLKKQHRRHSLWFHLYHNGKAHTLLGEAEMEIYEITRPVTTWIPLSDSRKCNARWGELMFSLSYLPTAERLTIVVVKARNLKLNARPNVSQVPMEIQNIFVKVYLMNNDKKILKKRTSLKRKDRCPIFNESMIFSLPPQGLTTVQLRLTVFGMLDNATLTPLGHVIVGSCATGKGLRHWHQMLSSLRKPVAMWHVLRQATKQPIFTGGAEAVVAAMQSTAIRAKRNSIF